MTRIVLLPALVAFVGCTAHQETTIHPDPAEMTRPSASALASAPTSSALLKEIAGKPASGYVLFYRGALMASSAQGVKKFISASSAPEKYFAVARVVAEEGDVVKVSTDLGKGARRLPLDARFILEGWLPKTDLVPVLNRPISKVFDNGTGYSLPVGLPLRVDKNIRPAYWVIASLPVDLRPEDIGISFDVADTLALPVVDGDELGCVDVPVKGDGVGYDEYRPPAVRVELLSVLQDEERKAALPLGTGFGLGRAGFPKYRCAVRSRFVVDSVPLNDKRDLQEFVNADKVQRQKDGTVLATMMVGEVANAQIRAVVKEKTLTTWGGGGAGYGGMTRQQRPALEIKPKSNVLYSDGTPAGMTGSDVVRVAKTGESQGKLCTTLSYIAEPICFAPEDVQEKVLSGIELLERMKWYEN